MIYVKALLLVCCIIAGILFGKSNADPAHIKFIIHTSQGYPLYLILFCCFLAGALVSYVYGILSAASMREEERMITAHIQDLEKIKARQEEQLLAIQAAPNTPNHEKNSTGSQTPPLAPKE